MIIKVLLGAGRPKQETQCTAELRCDRMLMECTHDEYDCMLLTLGTSNSRDGTDALKYPLHFRHRCYLEANVFRGLEQRLLEIETVTFYTHVNACRPRTVARPVKEDAIIAAVGR
jgi:hypothetical protein